MTAKRQTETLCSTDGHRLGLHPSPHSPSPHLPFFITPPFLFCLFPPSPSPSDFSSTSLVPPGTLPFNFLFFHFIYFLFFFPFLYLTSVIFHPLHQPSSCFLSFPLPLHLSPLSLSSPLSFLAHHSFSAPPPFLFLRSAGRCPHVVALFVSENNS